jgi:hypothetical protein
MQDLYPLVIAKAGNFVALPANEPLKQHHEFRPPSQSSIVVGDSGAGQTTRLLIIQLLGGNYESTKQHRRDGQSNLFWHWQDYSHLPANRNVAISGVDRDAAFEG